jgi:hypothetical protein
MSLEPVPAILPGARREPDWTRPHQASPHARSDSAQRLQVFTMKGNATTRVAEASVLPRRREGLVVVLTNALARRGGGEEEMARQVEQECCLERRWLDEEPAPVRVQSHPERDASPLVARVEAVHDCLSHERRNTADEFVDVRWEWAVVRRVSRWQDPPGGAGPIDLVEEVAPRVLVVGPSRDV